MRPQNRNWYPEHLKERGRAWPQPYVLHGYRGIDQPQERWDYAFPADVVFAFNNWLLAEFDRWIDSLPPDQRVTTAGIAKKELVRCSLYSYAFHDVPPHINLDPRIRVMIAGYPKHRGLGQWKQFATQHDMAAAFARMLPREPSGEYRIISIAYYADHTLDGIPARWSAAPQRIVDDLRRTFDGGVRAMAYETDFNFGKYGLAYYLMSKVLWNARLTGEQLDALRDRWLQRAFGAGWREMKTYYDFMLVDNFPANGAGTWAKAIRLIDAADERIDPTVEPDCQRRLDDLKQHWYWYYLLDTERARKEAPELIEFLWKGQMSYMTAMHMVAHRTFGQNSRLENLLPEESRRGPAHYSVAETAAWWRALHDHWPEIEVTSFAEAVLADGRRGRDVDINDLQRPGTELFLCDHSRPRRGRGLQVPLAVQGGRAAVLWSQGRSLWHRILGRRPASVVGRRRHHNRDGRIAGCHGDARWETAARRRSSPAGAAGGHLSGRRRPGRVLGQPRQPGLRRCQRPVHVSTAAYLLLTAARFNAGRRLALLAEGDQIARPGNVGSDHAS
jgi:hypothetical protein